MLILLQYIKQIKILCWICFFNIKLVYLKGFVSGSLKIFNFNWSNDCCVLFESIVQRNTTWWFGVCLRVAFINISALKCSVYSRAGFNWRNTEYVKYLHVNSVVPEIKYWQWGNIGETFTIQTVYFVVAKVKFLWITNHSHYEFHIKSQ